MQLVIRADASPAIGTGHVMRCLALAQAWEDLGGTVEWVTNTTGALRERLGLRNGAAGIPYAAGGAYVLDGYHFGADEQRAARQRFRPVLVIDDLADQPFYHADLLLNQNLHAHELSYRAEPHARLLAGPRYALLRREFRRWKGWERRIESAVRRILVTMGGGDPGNVTLRVLEALALCDLEEVEVVILAGAANPHLDSLREWVQGRAGYRLEAAVEDVAPLMAWADCAVTAAGSTCWETCFMGLPSAVVTLADNQAPVAESLAANGVALGLGWHTDLSPAAVAAAITASLLPMKCRRTMSQAGRDLVDGDGALRVAEAIRCKMGPSRSARAE
jgi:UDP-2,4-diacetamido-2,4,6-trideoxy-beta-L-altropyranose hydrolase